MNPEIFALLHEVYMHILCSVVCEFRFYETIFCILRKPVTLWTNCPWLEPLGQTMDREKRERLRGLLKPFCFFSFPSPVLLETWSGLQLAKKIRIVEHYIDSKGARKVKGGKHLRATEEYPYGLGLQVGLLYCVSFCVVMPCMLTWLLFTIQGNLLCTMNFIYFHPGI